MLLRTNPRLTTNVKLLYNGEKIFLETYPVSGYLSDSKYKSYKISPNSKYNEDIYNFYHQQRTELPKEIAYRPFYNTSESQFTTKYENQYETMYWQGAETIISKMYEEKFGVIAPLYIKKKMPQYFVIFKTPGPSNISQHIIEDLNTDDSDSSEYNETTNINYKLDVQELLSKSTIVKSFDLTSKSILGKYLYNYINQSSWKYEPMYVNMSTNEITYYGIDYSSGRMANRVESFKNTLCKNDLTIQIHDEYITEGYFRNNLIFPNIINIEFIFDDKFLEPYHFARYWGLYCNSIEFLSAYLKDTNFVSNEIVMDETNMNIIDYKYVDIKTKSSELNSETIVNAKYLHSNKEKIGRIVLHTDEEKLKK